MKTRAIIAAVIVALFWLAPKPSTSEARATHRDESTRITTESSRISIKPYVKPSHQAK